MPEVEAVLNASPRYAVAGTACLADSRAKYLQIFSDPQHLKLLCPNIKWKDYYLFSNSGGIQ